MNFKLLISLFLFVFSFFTQNYCQVEIDKRIEIKPIIREFRAAWVATVANINWPSEPGLTELEQKAEAIELLDLLERCNYNAVVFQVRPQADALYKSELEPWSYFLTGKQGIAPDDFYDPLEFWVKEAHKRNIELHAWVNPYRAHHKDGSTISEYSIVNQKPESVLKLKEGYWWFDPSLEETQDHSYIVVMDIARRYDIDGIHFDDYFYPYPSYNENEEFPDSLSWNEYLKSGGDLSRADWRRENVNQFVKRVYTGLKLMKPHILFGLSPFGIWRPNNPPSIKGFDQYEKLYADAKLWLNKGWIDYFSPQLYWKINDIEQSYPVLLGWWKEQNIKNRHLWPGSRIIAGADETINQIMVTRGMLPKSPGTIHWSIDPLVKDSTISKSLMSGPFEKQALVPKTNWLRRTNPKAPIVEINHENNLIAIKPIFPKRNIIRQWIIYFYNGEEWNYKISHISKESITLPKDNVVQLAISAVDIYNNESEIKPIALKHNQ